MKVMNKVQLIGNMGLDPETRFPPGSFTGQKFRMAVYRIFKNKEVENPRKSGLLYP